MRQETEEGATFDIGGILDIFARRALDSKARRKLEIVDEQV